MGGLEGARTAVAGFTLAGLLVMAAAQELRADAIDGASAPSAWPVAIRVLLEEGAGPLSVAPSSGPAVSIRATRGGVAEAGAPARSSWSTTARGGPVGVAGLRVGGRVDVIRTERGLAAINTVALEPYVAATLGGEMYARWPAEALRAQAVAIRSYALYHALLRRREAWDLGAGTASQVYRGVDAEAAEVLAAVDSTRGEVLTWGGAPILAAFHSASGGRTASAREVWGGSLPYLVSIPVENEDDSPDTYWRAPVSRTTLGRAVKTAGSETGPVRMVRVTRRSQSGRVLAVELRGDRGRVTLDGRTLRSALGASTLKSTLFEVESQTAGFVFVGSGSGHGVGMSQWGARAMAKAGASYREILAEFYPGVLLEHAGERRVQKTTAHTRRRSSQRNGDPR